MNPTQVGEVYPYWIGEECPAMTNIVVLVKQVPDTNARIVISDDRVDLSSVKMVMSPYDEFAV